MRASLDKTLRGNRARITSLFLLDLDRFKAVNDTLGHQMGDALLKQVGQRLQRSVGETGLVGRLGGDEFQIVLPGEGNRDRLGTWHGRHRIAVATLFHRGSSITIGCSIASRSRPRTAMIPKR